ncbi:MAG: methionyl-tRNA formyltransferase [Candidatus Saccharimonadales bacterium]|jgi:methionyl-tRNA formyltransferase
MLKIVFFGSGPVAAESLRLLSNDFEIEAVVTKPTTLREMEAVSNSAPIHTVSDKHDLDVLFSTSKFDSSIGVLIDFGIIVSDDIINYFPEGIVNSHFSLLPELRGPDPISFAILEGKETTGVSLMMLVKAMDEGPILATGLHPLDGTETGPSLTKSLVNLSHSLLKNTVPAYINNLPDAASGVIPAPQSQEKLCSLLNKEYKPTYTRKLTKQDGEIDWTKPAVQIEREVRGYAGWPKSRTAINSIDCVVTCASVLNENSTGEPGSLFFHNKKLAIVCGENALVIEAIKPAGKKEMDSIGFLNGYRNRLGI